MNAFASDFAVPAVELGRTAAICLPAVQAWMQEQLGEAARITLVSEQPSQCVNGFALRFDVDAPASSMDRLYRLGFRKGVYQIDAVSVQMPRRAEPTPVRIRVIEARDPVAYVAGRAQRSFTVHCQLGRAA
ncbi:MAG TPA: hypothetical protein VN222_02840 [Novosphingobium sp.]|nr:hypothetical protein [Novosphingobium sp.]